MGWKKRNKQRSKEEYMEGFKDGLGELGNMNPFIQKGDAHYLEGFRLGSNINMFLYKIYRETGDEYG